MILISRPQPDKQEVSVGCFKMRFCFCNTETIQAYFHACYFALMVTEESLLEVSRLELEDMEHMKSPQDNARFCIKMRYPEATCGQRTKTRDIERKRRGTMSSQTILFSCLVSLWPMRMTEEALSDKPIKVLFLHSALYVSQGRMLMLDVLWGRFCAIALCSSPLVEFQNFVFWFHSKSEVWLERRWNYSQSGGPQYIIIRLLSQKRAVMRSYKWTRSRDTSVHIKMVL